MSIQRIYLVRHGETDFNVQHRWQGHLQTPLNENGQAQVAALGEYFKTIAVDEIISSDLIRAHDTAHAIAEAKGMTIVDDVRWREFSLGAFEGRTRDELLELMPEAVEQWNNSSDFAPEGGESRNQTQVKAYSAWLDVSSRDDIETALVVSHGGTLRMVMKAIFADDMEKIRHQKLHFSNTSITILEKSGENWDIVALNTTPHLNEA